MSAIDAEAFRAARARDHLRGNPDAQRRSICEFIISNSNIALDLKRFLGIRDRTEQGEEVMNRIAAEIEEDFLRCFGHKMIQQDEQD